MKKYLLFSFFTISSLIGMELSNNNNRVRKLALPNNIVVTAANYVRGDKGKILLGGYCGSIYKYDREHEEIEEVWEDPELQGAITSIAVVANNPNLIMVGKKKLLDRGVPVYLWDVRQNKKAMEVDAPDEGVVCADLCKSDPYLIAMGCMSKLLIFDRRNTNNFVFDIALQKTEGSNGVGSVDFQSNESVICGTNYGIEYTQKPYSHMVSEELGVVDFIAFREQKNDMVFFNGHSQHICIKRLVGPIKELCESKYFNSFAVNPFNEDEAMAVRLGSSKKLTMINLDSNE